MTSQFAITSIDVDLPTRGEKRLSFTREAGPRSHVTVLVGRNGTGKSTILREIAMSFRQYYASEALRSRQGLARISHINIRLGQQTATLNLKLDAKAYRAEREAMRANNLSPTKLIALSFTPFDKFPPIDDTRYFGHPDAKRAFYVYLGFKADVRLSPRTRLLRSIDQLAFALSEPDSDARVARAFAAIGYAPAIKLEYDLRPKSGANRTYKYEHVAQELEARLKAMSDRDPNRREAAFSYYIDFHSGYRDGPSPISFEELRDHTRTGVLRLVSVSLTRLDGGLVELLELSSGELNLLSGFLGLAAFLEDGCVILIDEPENSLHPEWQIRYVEMLEAVLKEYDGCHYIVATHSPLIVSGVAGRDATVLRLDGEPIEVMPEAIENASPDATLLNAFQVVTAGNNFLKQLVLEALTLIDTGQHGSERARDIATFLASLYEQVPAEDPMRGLIANVVQAILQAR